LFQKYSVKIHYFGNFKYSSRAMGCQLYLMFETVAHDDDSILSHFKTLLGTKHNGYFYCQSSCNFILKILIVLDLELFFQRWDYSYFLQFSWLVSDEKGDFVHLMALNWLKIQCCRNYLYSCGLVDLSLLNWVWPYHSLVWDTSSDGDFVIGQSVWLLVEVAGIIIVLFWLVFLGI
jgi:hypothetical protein